MSVSLTPQIKIDTPYPLNPRFAGLRQVARRKEVFVGIVAYLSTTREGNSILAGLLAGVIAGWYIMQSLVT
jgi:hypothetical protein